MSGRDPAPATRSAVGSRRAAVVVVDDGFVALIRRQRSGRRYHLFPGGGVEPGETDEVAAIREAHEELGVRVEIVRLLGTVFFGASTQTYFEARRGLIGHIGGRIVRADLVAARGRGGGRRPPGRAGGDARRRQVRVVAVRDRRVTGSATTVAGQRIRRNRYANADLL